MIAGLRNPPNEKLVENHAQRVDIAADPCRLASSLLRWHMPCRCPSSAKQRRDAEIGEYWLVEIGQVHAGRAEIAMKHIVAVRVIERLRDHLEQPCDVGW